MLAVAAAPSTTMDQRRRFCGSLWLRQAAGIRLERGVALRSNYARLGASVEGPEKGDPRGRSHAHYPASASGRTYGVAPGHSKACARNGGVLWLSESGERVDSGRLFPENLGVRGTRPVFRDLPLGEQLAFFQMPDLRGESRRVGIVGHHDDRFAELLVQARQECQHIRC